MMSHIVTATIGAALALTATTASTGAQQDFPTKPVQLMVAYPPGGSTDIGAPGAVFRLVHLEGGAAQFKEIMAGNIDVAFDNVGSIMTRVKSGEVRALAVMDDVRSKFLPDVPTMKELGYPTVMSNSTRGIAG